MFNSSHVCLYLIKASELYLFQHLMYGESISVNVGEEIICAHVKREATVQICWHVSGVIAASNRNFGLEELRPSSEEAASRHLTRALALRRSFAGRSSLPLFLELGSQGLQSVESFC